MTNNSIGKPYYTQRNNAIKPNTACNVTAMIAALSAAGWPVDHLATELHPQPEDALMHFILSDKTIDTQWKRIDPAGKNPPNEWHQFLAAGTNLWLESAGLAKKETVVDYGEKRTISDILVAIENKGAAVLSGSFPAKNGTGGLAHVVAVVGYSRNSDDSINLVIDDSWGNYNDKYETQNGNDVDMSEADFIKIIRPSGNRFKLAHLVKAYKESAR